MAASFIERHLCKVMRTMVSEFRTRESVSGTCTWNLGGQEDGEAPGLWSMMTSCLQCGGHHAHQPPPIPGQKAYMHALHCGFRYRSGLRKKTLRHPNNLRVCVLEEQHVTACRNAWRYSIVRLARQMERDLGYNAYLTPYFYEVLDVLEKRVLQDPDFEMYLQGGEWEAGRHDIGVQDGESCGVGNQAAMVEVEDKEGRESDGEANVVQETDFRNFDGKEEGGEAGEDEVDEALGRLLRTVSLSAGACTTCVTQESGAKRQELLQGLLPLMVRYDRLATHVTEGSCGSCGPCVSGEPCVHDWREVGVRPEGRGEAAKDALLQLGGLRRRKTAHRSGQ